MSGAAPFDALVVGGGHNGLVAAALLARAGRRTLLLEASDRLGGMATLAQDCGRLSPTVVRELGLERCGLRLSARAPRTHLLLGPDRRVTIDPDDVAATRAALAALSPRDADAWPGFQQRMARLAAGLAPFLEQTPPRLSFSDWRARWPLLKLAFAVRRMGRADMRDLLRILPMNVADLAEEVFETDALQGLVAFDAVLGDRLGARSPNSVFTLMLRYAGGAPGRPGTPLCVEGGASALIAALETAARGFGAEIRTEAPVARILVEDGAAAGVALEDGTELRAPLVLSSAHPGATLLNLVGPRWLDGDFVRAVRLARGRGVTARLDLTLDGPPPGLVDAAGDRFVHAPSIAMVERAFDAMKYGGVPQDPPFALRLAARDGALTASALVHGAPHDLRGADWAEEGPRLAARIVERLETHWPGFKARVTEARLTDPAQVAARFGAPGGHWHHLELGLDQAFLLRPVPGWAQYATPIDGLFLCGAGAHPGGWITGQPGLNGARAALAAASAGRARAGAGGV
ncbi:MAG: NAD(P)/FAD-dependent oxidoreductase [Alphaproteobacteria bacterium]|nr:NAD(P)/FAD-dependent oxidoreductase [Alphaproteobacteria bacterium]